MTTTADSSVADEPLLDEEWLAAPRQRSRLRVGLATLLAVSVCFLAGALVQKHFGAEPSAAAGGPGEFPGGVPDGFPGGPEGFPGGGAQPPGGDTGPPAGQTGNAAEDDTDAVVGTVVSIDGDIWTVEDLGGKKHKVRVTDDSDLIRETRLTADEVAVGDRVDISGATADGQLTADDVTLR